MIQLARDPYESRAWYPCKLVYRAPQRRISGVYRPFPATAIRAIVES